MPRKKQQFQVFYVDHDGEVHFGIATKNSSKRNQMDCVFTSHPNTSMTLSKKDLLSEPVEVEKKLIEIGGKKKAEASKFMKYSRSWRKEFQKSINA